MKVIEITAMSFYSVGQIAMNIKDVLEEQGHTCYVFYSRGPKRIVEGVTRVNPRFSQYLAALSCRFFDNDGRFLFFETKNLIKRIDRIKPDIVHIHCLHGYYLDIRPLFSYFQRNPQISIVWTMHDAWAFTGHCCFYSKIGCDKWKTGCHFCPQKRSYPTSFFLDESKKNYAIKKQYFSQLSKKQLTIVSPCNWMDRQIANSFLSSFNRKVIFNGIKAQALKTEILERKKVLLGIAGVWDDRKGLPFFLRAAVLLSSSWRILLVGKIPSRLKKNLPSKIEYFGSISSRSRIDEIYQMSSILFNPTIDDNFPTVNIEAQKMGLKVLTFDTGGSSETNCGNLYICGTHAPNEIAALIEKIDDFPLKSIDKQAFSSQGMADEYSSLFSEILRTKK